MTTETKIAKENLVRINNKELPEMNQANISGMIIEHKQSCERYLEFLKKEMERWETIIELSEAYISTGELEEQITDMKQAIKLYENAGI
ncbi:hypothetical protein LCGC14_0729950 [marine sediment metagenome]|uniref:Tetratricopeptide repeat protein n=1 Tax=marine sediment metagenome TaxID=412755 RepID=A0A0F9QE47_9ZZZZ